MAAHFYVPHHIVLTPFAISLFIRLLYCSRNCIRPKVPRPTARKKAAVHTEVMTRPMGKKARLVPGRTKGAAAAAAAVAEAAAAGSSVLVVPVPAKTPLTKDASWDEREAVSASPEGEVAESSICGMRRGWRVALWEVSLLF
jgi:hypothetical protein